MIGILITLVVVIAIAALILWGITQFPLDPTLAKIIRVVVIIAVAIYCIILLANLAGWHGANAYPMR